jgi:predicted phosphodiesterase
VRVAALYDVHGFVHALEAVLAEVERERVDAVVFGGDIVHGPFPVETFELALAVPNARFVRGNADLLREPTGAEVNDRARRWAIERLGPQRVEWLARMPFSQSLDDTLYVHANPVDVYDAVTPSTPDEHVAKLLAGVEERQVVTGHVHLQFERDVGGIRWVGAGSVGMPYEEELAAYWALVDDGEVAFRRTDYDIERAEAALVASGHPRAAEYGAIRDGGRRWVTAAR